MIAPDTPDPIVGAQHRWIAGHQLTFSVWRRLAEALESLTQGPPSRRSVELAATLYDAYSVLLLYCGSCSPEVYADAIRPHMVRASPAFTGRWARDWQCVGIAMRHLRATVPSVVHGELHSAAIENVRVHRLIAARLIPDGQSLLQRSDRDKDATPTDEECDIYDAFFGVDSERRVYKDPNSLLQQRLSVVRKDLLADPLPVPCGWEGFGVADRALVDRFHKDSVAILDDMEARINGRH